MRSLIVGMTVMLASLGLMVASPHKAQAQDANQSQPGEGNWYYNYGPYYYGRGGEHHAGWTWQEGRHHYPGYRYYDYPHYGIRVYGGGSYYYAPGYYYPRPHDTRP
jgi:hypothetical protein